MIHILFLFAAIASPSEGDTRSFRVAPSAQFLLAEPVEDLGPVGAGLYSVYEFHLKRNFIIGINMSLRHYPSSVKMSQLGYGLILKHYLADGEVRPFVDYGLLMQVSFLSDRSGSGTAHDTRLAGGADFELGGQTFFVELAFHYSRLSFFEFEKLRLDNLEFDVGWQVASW